MATLFNALPAPEPQNDPSRYYWGEAEVTVGADDAPAQVAGTYRADRFDIMGDGKVLKVLRFNTDTMSVEDAFAAARKRARRVDGATSIRYGQGTYTI